MPVVPVEASAASGTAPDTAVRDTRDTTACTTAPDITVAGEAEAPVTAKPHPPIPRPPIHPPTSAPPAPTSGPPANGGDGGDPPRPSPHHLAELSGAFAMTASVHDPEPTEHEPQPPRPAREDDNHDQDHHPHHHEPHQHHHHHDEVVSERGLRGLVGGGASQVSVSSAMRARDAARPTDADLAAADRDLQIIRRGWVPREELTRPGRRSPTS